MKPLERSGVQNLPGLILICHPLQPTDCIEMMFTCEKFLVDNRDPFKCKKGNALSIKPKGESPRRSVSDQTKLKLFNQHK